jgi:hypothetical protein
MNILFSYFIAVDNPKVFNFAAFQQVVYKKRKSTQYQ